METRANYLAIGTFALLVFAMAFGFVYWLVRFNESSASREVQLIVPGNAGGLSAGNGVLFNGLRVGSVKEVALSQADPSNVYAILTIKATTPLREDTQITIASQPLTGLSNVSLIGGSPDKDLILMREVIPPLMAKQSSLNETLEAAADTVRIATSVLKRVETMVDQNSTAISKTVSNVEVFSTALADNSSDIEALLENVGKASTAIATLSETLDGVSNNVNAIVTAIDPGKIQSTLANVEKISGDLARGSGEVDIILGDARKVVESFSGVAGNLNAAVAAINQEQIANTLTNVEKISTDLARGSGEINALLGDAKQVMSSFSGLTDNLNKTVAAIDSDKVASTVANVEKITGDLARGSGEVDVLLDDAKKAVRSFSGLADNLNKTVTAIDSDKVANTVANVEKITDDLARGSGEVDVLLGDAKKAVRSFSGLTDNLNKTVIAIDSDKVATTVANVEKITGDLARGSDGIEAILEGARKAVNSFSSVAEELNTTVTAIDGQQLARTLANVEGFSGDLRNTLKKVDGVVGAFDSVRINKALASLEGFASRLDSAGGEIDTIIANAKTATEDVTDFTGALSENKENFNKIITDATLISERLIRTSEAITKLVGRVDGLVEADGRGFIVEVTDAAKSIRRVAESFEARADAISGGLERFSTRGLGDIEALIGQSRQAVTRIETLVRSFESNPSQFLLGGKKVPEYRRQRR